MQHASDERSQPQELQYRQVTARVERPEEVHHSTVVLQVHLAPRGAKQHQRHEQERYAKEEVARVAETLAAYQHVSHKEAGEHHGREVHVVTERQNPCRERGAYVGSHYHRNGLRQGEQSGRDKRYGHHRRGRRRLHGAGYGRSGKHPRKSVGGHSRNNVP